VDNFQALRILGNQACLLKLLKQPENGLRKKIVTKISSVSLRLWAGCICAAKLVGLSTKSGPNTSQIRTSGFANVDTLATQDRTFGSGVEDAPEFEIAQQRI
jgi:hypothetical protein